MPSLSGPAGTGRCCAPAPHRQSASLLVVPVRRTDMLVISTIGLPSAYIRASTTAYGSGP